MGLSFSFFSCIYDKSIWPQHVYAFPFSFVESYLFTWIVSYKAYVVGERCGKLPTNTMYTMRIIS